jgi:cystathionine beta-lyase
MKQEIKKDKKMFEQIADHTKVNLVKRDATFQQNYFGATELLPFWVADMDFEITAEVKDALHDRVEKGIFGYEKNSDGLKKSVINWFDRRHNWKMDKQFLRTSPSIMASIGVLINLLTKEGDGVLVQTPSFPKFLHVVPNNDRKLILNPLKPVEGRYEIDFVDFEKKAKESKVFILCNPHNPVGRVWTYDELKTLGRIAKENDMYIISDEIHSDIIFKGHTFIPYGSFSEDLTEMSISLFSPAKTFNLPSNSSSFLYSTNKDVLKKFDKFMLSMYLDKTTALESIAMETAYNTGDKWLNELLAHIEDTVNYINGYFKDNIPQIKVTQADGMYLVWLDFRELNIDAQEFNKLLVDEGIALNPGNWFGEAGVGFLRMNIATSRDMVNQGLKIIKRAVDKITNKSSKCC